MFFLLVCFDCIFWVDFVTYVSMFIFDCNFLSICLYVYLLYICFVINTFCIDIVQLYASLII